MLQAHLKKLKDNYQSKGDFLQTVVKKWYRDKATGLLDNRGGPDIVVRKSDLVDCQFLKVGATVEFECHLENRDLVAKKVRLLHQKNSNDQDKGHRSTKEFRFGVMT